jgi:hypothetical protein
MIGLEFGLAAGADVVQHENAADACEDWPQQIMRARKVKRFQSCADNGVADHFHKALAGLFHCVSNITMER